MILENRRRFTVVQLGARMRYAVPAAFESAGMLERFYSDLCLPDWLAGGARSVSGIPSSKIIDFPLMGLGYIIRRNSTRCYAERYSAYSWAGRKICELAVKRGLGNADSVYTYNTAALEILEHAKARNLFTVLEQIAPPHQIETDLVGEEESKFGDWVGSTCLRGDPGLSRREKAEWDKADMIICGSEFVREGIRFCGGPSERCVVIPYGSDSHGPGARGAPRSGPLRILTVGTVCLRKGAPHILAAASALRGKAEFRMVGPIGVSPYALHWLKSSVDVKGPVAYRSLGEHYRWADVFLLPSISEGSAVAIYEALAHGLPVITTPNSGSVVRDCLDGFIVPIRDPKAIIDKIRYLAARRGLLEKMSKNAFNSSAGYTMAEYKKRLIAAVSNGKSTLRTGSV